MGTCGEAGGRDGPAKAAQRTAVARRGRGLPAEGLVDASLQLAGALQGFGLATAAGDVQALEPAEPRAAARCVGRTSDGRG